MTDTTTQTRLERWAPGHLNRIASDIDEARAQVADPDTDSARVLWNAMEIERLRAEAALVRILVADREVGVASMYYDLRGSGSDSQVNAARAKAKADAVLWFLSQYGHMLTDQEIRRATCGPTAAPYCGG